MVFHPFLMLLIIIIYIISRGYTFIFSLLIHLSLLENLHVPYNGYSTISGNINSSKNNIFTLLISSSYNCFYPGIQGTTPNIGTSPLHIHHYTWGKLCILPKALGLESTKGYIHENLFHTRK